MLGSLASNVKAAGKTAVGAAAAGAGAAATVATLGQVQATKDLHNSGVKMGKEGAGEVLHTLVSFFVSNDPKHHLQT